MDFMKEENYWNDRKWFDFCQECLKNKYIDQDYQCLNFEESLEFGYSGFNEYGVVFITFCQDVSHAKADKYIKSDLEERINKIVNIEKENALFNEDFNINCIKIITPKNLNFAIKNYLRKLEPKFKNSGAHFINEQFKILFWDIDYFSEQIPTILKSRKFLYDFSRGEITEEVIQNFSNTNVEYINNLNNKLQTLLLENNMIEEIDDMKNGYIMSYLQGKFLMDDLAENIEPLFSELMILIKKSEDSIRIKSMSKQDNNIIYLDNITNEFERSLTDGYKDIFHNNDIYEINKYVISDWLMRCPLNFR